jgi:hypothetical protein
VLRLNQLWIGQGDQYVRLNKPWIGQGNQYVIPDDLGNTHVGLTSMPTATIICPHSRKSRPI